MHNKNNIYIDFGAQKEHIMSHKKIQWQNVQMWQATNEEEEEEKELRKKIHHPRK